MKTARYIFFVLLLSACSETRNYFIECRWKYQEGYHIGDVLHFEESGYYSIEDNTKIYRNGIHVATLKEVTKEKLKIVSIDNEIGLYTFFDEGN